MRNLLLMLISLFFLGSANAQSPCNHSLTLTDISTATQLRLKADINSGAVTGNKKTYYKIDWGDNSTIHNFYGGQTGNFSYVHNYSTDGIYTVKVIVTVVDTNNGVGSVVCVDSSSKTDTLVLCNVGANAQYDTVLNGKVFFSVNNPNSFTNYAWNFGDGNTGNGASVSHTYAQHNKYTVTLTATNFKCNKTVTLNNITPVNGCSNIAGLMSYSIPPNQTGPYTVNFYANANAWQSNIGIYYTWDYGDGSSSSTSWTNANTSHSYSNNGLYNVKLLIELYDSTNNSTICKDSVIKQVRVGPPIDIWTEVVLDSVNTVQGDTFKIWLIQFDSATNILSAVDSVIRPRGNGISNYKITHAFINKPAGSYRVKAAPVDGPVTGTGYIPTYSTSALLWSNANVINHTSSSSSWGNILMQKGTVTSGPGFVGGNVSQGANKGTGSGIEGMNILLLDANGDVVTYAVTDANGDYNFDKIPTGTYTVHPEDMGYATTPASINITNGQATVKDINFERSKKDLTIKPKPAGIDDINSTTVNYEVYPNPAKDVVNIKWITKTNKAATITITDISGKNVYTGQAAMSSNAVINVQSLQAGFYFLNIATEADTTTQKLVIE